MLRYGQQLVHEIAWTERKIHELRADEKRLGPTRRSHEPQIRQYQYQIRHKELTLAFGE
jgi:hypothetical protein